MRRSLVVLCLFVVSLTLAVTAAAGTKPVTESFEFSESFVDREACGFKVTVSFVGDGTVTFFSDGTAKVHINETFSVSAKGKTFSDTDAFNVFVSDTSEALVGLVMHLTVPGGGIVLLDAGKVVFDETGVAFVAGPHQVLEGDFAKLCAALAA